MIQRPQQKGLYSQIPSIILTKISLHYIISCRMKISPEFKLLQRSSKSIRTPLNAPIEAMASIRNPLQKIMISPPPQLCVSEKTNKKRICASPPPFLLSQSDPQSLYRIEHSQRNNSSKNRVESFLRVEKKLEPNLNKSFSGRAPPLFLKTIQKGKKGAGDDESIRRNLMDEGQRQKRAKNEENEQWKPRLSANLAYLSKRSSKPKSNLSRNQKSSQYWSPEKKLIGSAVSSITNKSQNSNPQALVPPTKPNSKVRSEHSFNHQQSQQSKVPAFIRNKQHAKSQKESNSKSKSSQSQKGLQLLAMLNSAEVASHDNSSTKGDGLEITINIKPAQRKRSLQDFQLIKQLGQGSYGKAFLAIQKELHFICVLKTIEKEKLTEFQVNNLMRQIKIQSFLNHQHITSLYGCFDDDQQIYLIMQLLPSGSLRDNVKNKAQPQKNVSKTILQVCKGIYHMHANHVLHRDLKPENIFMFGSFVKLGDFGCSVYSDNIARNSFVGSPCYLSPEQLKNEFYDEKVDMWEIGILTYELLFKKCPFEKDILQMMQGTRKMEDLSELIFPAHIPVSEEAKDFIRRALNKSSVRRMSLDEAINHKFLLNSAKEMQVSKLIH